MDNLQNKTSKKRKREEKDEDLENIITSHQNKTQFFSKVENQKRILEQDLTFWDNIKKERVSDLLDKDKSFSFGNYDRYYYKRYLEALKDPRLDLFQEEWFKNKTVLDIGCNDGTLTILTAVTYQPTKIEGIDIDHKLITKAVKNMKYVVRNNLNKNLIESANAFYFNDINPNEESNNVNADNVNLIDEILQNDNHEKQLKKKNLQVSTAGFQQGVLNNKKSEINQEMKVNFS
jgi:ribosomal protein L11 methylase PrmA